MTPGPIFVGGTGRCGTHALASLVARSGRYEPVPAELRLHVSWEGLLGFAAGKLGRRDLVGSLLGQWWRRRPPWGGPDRGSHRIASRTRYGRALARLAACPPGTDRIAIARRFVRGLLDPLAAAPGAWVEKSPDNCAAAGFLHRLFPDMRLIHVVRDGRDVACSYMRVPWAPDDFDSALVLWEHRLLKAHRGTLEVPPEQVHTVALEDLVLRDRDAAYEGLLGFLEVPDHPRVRSFFDRELTAGRAGIGRWRSDLPPSAHAEVEALHRGSRARLIAAGVPLGPEVLQNAAAPDCPPDPDARTPSPLDPWAATTAAGF